MPDLTIRKRETTQDGTSGSKKRKADAQSKNENEVQVVSILKPQFSPPVIAIPAIPLSRSTPLFPYIKTEKSSKKRRKTDSKLGPEMVLHSSLQHPTIDYTARENRPNGADPHLFDYIAIYDHKTNTVEVIRGRKMVVRGTVRSQTATDESMAEQTTKQSMSEMRSQLGEAFGTKKAKKAIKSAAENAISSTKLGAAELEVLKTIDTSAQRMATQEELQAAIDLAKPVPRANLDAEEIQDVYPPEVIIGAEILRSIPIMDWQEGIKQGETILSHSRFVANRVRRVAQNEDAVQRLRVLRYLSWVIVFWLTVRSGKIRGTKSAAPRDKLRELMTGAPEVVIENIRRKFSDGGVIRKTHTDLLMTHCCVYSLIVDNFESNTLDLKEDLKVEQKELNQYYAEVGASIKTKRAGGNVDNIAKLSLPLVFPKVRQARRRN